jgi:hypothetical protein
MSYTQESNFTQFGPIRKSSGNNSEGVGIGNAFAPSFVDAPKPRTRRQDLTNAVENTANSWPVVGTDVVQPQWVEIDVCVNSVAKKIKIWATEPY